MAISKIKIGNTAHDIQTTIANVTGLQAALDGKAGTAVATTSANGLMTSAMVTKLNGIATGANKTTINDTLTSTSTTEALSANQGRVLQGNIANTNAALSFLVSDYQELSEQLNTHTHDYNTLTNTPCGEALETIFEQTLRAYWSVTENYWEDNWAVHQQTSLYDTSKFENGELYTITIGDNIYADVPCFEASAVDSQYPSDVYGFGNPSLCGFPINTGHPFAIIVDNVGLIYQMVGASPNGRKIVILAHAGQYLPTPENPTVDTTADINIKIEASTGIKKLDPKYLPDEITENQIYVGDDEATASTPLNADTLGGRQANEYALKSEIENLVNIPSFVVLSQAEYDALTTKDPNTIYYIYEEV